MYECLAGGKFRKIGSKNMMQNIKCSAMEDAVYFMSMQCCSVKSIFLSFTAQKK